LHVSTENNNTEDKTDKIKDKEDNPTLNVFFDNSTFSNGSVENTIITIFGDIDEDASKECVLSIFEAAVQKEMMASVEQSAQKEEKEEEEAKEKTPPLQITIKILLSTPGGNAHDFFAIYDAMKCAQDLVEIETVGLGRVMSAGVPILAAGTKGKRKIGKNCRIMIHPVNAASMGDIHDIENDTKEFKTLQRSYIRCLVESSNLSEKEIKKILKKKVNTYFSAEEAIEMGIADTIL